MRIVHAAFLVLAIAPAAHAQSADDAVLVGYLRDLEGRAALKTDDLEVAAFIIADDDGGLVCRMWPHTANRASEHYDGAIPKGTIAVAHSHPYRMPQPSRNDIDLAQRLKIRVYVVSRWELHVVEPEFGKDVTLLRGQGWTRAPAPHHCN